MLLLLVIGLFTVRVGLVVLDSSVVVIADLDAFVIRLFLLRLLFMSFLPFAAILSLVVLVLLALIDVVVFHVVVVVFVAMLFVVIVIAVLVALRVDVHCSALVELLLSFWLLFVVLPLSLLLLVSLLSFVVCLQNAA